MAKPRKPTPSSETTRKARLRRLFKEHRNDPERLYLKAKLVTGNTALISYAGYDLEFIRKEGIITVQYEKFHYLEPEDWVFLSTYAEELMDASINGYKSRKKKAPSQEDLKILSGEKQTSFNFMMTPLAKEG